MLTPMNLRPPLVPVGVVDGAELVDEAEEDEDGAEEEEDGLVDELELEADAVPGKHWE